MSDQDRNGISRRGVLQAGLVAAAGVGVAGGWSAADAAVLPDARRLRKPGSRPFPNLPVGHDSVPQIEHIVVLMMENHSYDNRFGMLKRPGADGFQLRQGKPIETNLYANGDVQHAFHMPTTCQQKGHPSQDWTASHVQFNSGKNNGFVKSASGPVSMGYWDGTDQPFYYSMASVFPIGDRYFCSVLGQTYPNRRFLISATSLGQVNDTIPSLSDYPKNGTIFDKLDQAKVSWKDYVSSTGILGSTLGLYPKLFLKNEGKNVVPIGAPAASGTPATGFFADAAGGTLPSFSLVEPDYQVQSEENPQNIAAGEEFAASVINAVMSGPAWGSTLLIWTYDEHGGYYDHVPPPRALAPDTFEPKLQKGRPVYERFRRYGFRVPMAVVSPFSRPDYVSHHVMDHTSICALAEHKWNLPAMTYRDANAWPMLDLVDLSNPAFAVPPTLSAPLLVTDPQANACSTTGPGKIPPPGSVGPPRTSK